MLAAAVCLTHIHLYSSSILFASTILYVSLLYFLIPIFSRLLHQRPLLLLLLTPKPNNLLTAAEITAVLCFTSCLSSLLYLLQCYHFHYYHC